MELFDLLNNMLNQKLKVSRLKRW